MKKKMLIGILFFLLSAFAACGKKEPTPTPDPLAGLTEKPTATPFVTPAPGIRSEKTIQFSLDKNFLSETDYLELSAEGATAIYYTIDGSTPCEESELYDTPIMLRAAAGVNVVPVSARALFEDGTWSDTVVETYIVGTKVASRYDCLVIALTTDPDNLFDYETGIFAKGKIYDDYIKAHPKTVVDGSTPANYNQLRGKEGERPVNVEIFNSDGTLVLEQNAGIRCYGGWSRASAMKPMKLLARKEYSETDNKFRYPFFVTSFDENNELIDSFKRLVLRAAGNDNGRAFMRDELFQTLAGQAGYISKAVRPCAVYVNGEYYGAYWLTEVYHESYFEAHYGKFDGHFEILEGSELNKDVDEDGENKAYVDDFNEAYEKFRYADLTDDALYAECCKLFDVQNFLEYYAFQMFIANEDWPQNNVKVFRYYGSDENDYGEGVFDGRWRFLLHDMDYSSGIYNGPATARNYTFFLGAVNKVKANVPLFGRLMQRDDCKKIFITKMLDLINGVFADDYFGEQVDELNASRLNEQTYSYSSGKMENWVNRSQLQGNIDSLKKWIRSRGNYLYLNTISFFKLGGSSYVLNVTVPEKVEITINSWTVTENFTGRYYQNIDTTLTAEDSYGRKPEGWLVNGSAIGVETLVIDDLKVGESTELTVEPVFDGFVYPER